ncbi:MAG: O-antigen ligase family protein [Desulfobacterales bacterium]|nr:O-antigen ligase family protein [Desulfobacterales bacterium]
MRIVVLNMMNFFKNLPQNDSVDVWLFRLVALTFFLLPIGTSPPLISAILAVVVFIAAGRIKMIPGIVSTVWFWPVLFLLVIPWLWLMSSENLDLGIDYAMKGKYWCVAFVTASLCISHSQVYTAVKCLWAGLTIGALVALYQAVVHGFGYQDFLGFGITHTLLSNYLIIGMLMVGFYFKQTSDKRVKVSLLMMALLFLFHMAVLRGKSGYLVFILAAPFIARDILNRWPNWVKGIVALIMVLSFLSFPPVLDRIMEPFKQLKTMQTVSLEDPDSEVEPRFFIFSQAALALKQHPIMGIGTGSFLEFTRANGVKKLAHPHNNLIYMWVSFGIAGLFCILWLFGRLFFTAWKGRHTALGYLILTSSLVLFATGMFDTQILNTNTLLMLTIIYGLQGPLIRIREKEMHG